MFACLTFYEKKHKPLIEKAIEAFNNTIFLCWKSKPEFKIIDLDYEEPDEEPEIEFHIRYSNPTCPERNSEQGHEAMDLAQAFIDGMLYQKEKENEE